MKERWYHTKLTSYCPQQPYNSNSCKRQTYRSTPSTSCTDYYLDAIPHLDFRNLPVRCATLPYRGKTTALLNALLKEGSVVSYWLRKTVSYFFARVGTIIV